MTDSTPHSDEPTAQQPVVHPAAAEQPAPAAPPAPAATPAPEQPTVAEQPQPLPAQPLPAQPVPAQPYAAAPPATKWYSRRVPILATGAALLVGCIIGACGVGALAVASHFGDHGGYRAPGHDNRRFDGPGLRNGGPGNPNGPGRVRPDNRRGNNLVPAPTASAPVPVPSTTS
jgi:hypothetical protein